jgi:hypothetical protein
MEPDPHAQELLHLYWETRPEHQQALLQCARLLVIEEPDFLPSHLVEHMAIQTRLLVAWRRDRGL